jgi:hypothetical protein
MIKTNAVSSQGLSNAVSAAKDIHGIKAPVSIPNIWLWIWLTLALLLAAAVAWWIWKKRRRQTLAPPAEVIVPAHEKARARLKDALALLDQPRPFCILVSDTIRVYLEERFNLRAPERTTEEFLEELQHSALLSHDQKQTLGEFLMGCDLVKFARYEPRTDELQAIYDAAVRLIDETQPPPPVPEQPSPPSAVVPSSA